MWILSGPFDGELTGDVGFQKTKLLKPNTSYAVGRKGQPLLINSKKVSHQHCQFDVGEHTMDDVSNPSSRPSIVLINWNKKDKTILISRGGKEVHAFPSTKEPLQDGDIVSLISGIVVNVHWKPLCAYSPPSLGKSLFSVDVCAPLGIKLVHTPHVEVTHHITTDYIANLSSMSSLLSLCQFVKPEWLQEVIKLGTVIKNAEFKLTSLEDHYILPLESKYRPSFSPSLSPSQKTLSIWEPNEERVNLFQTCRFICLHEKVRETDTDLREAIHRGGGSLENFDIHSGLAKFRRALTRGQVKEGKKTVVVGDTDSMRMAVGNETWGQFVAEAYSFALEIVTPSKVAQAVLEVNIDILFESNSMDVDGGSNQAPTLSPLPDIIPNTLAEEPSIAPSTQATRPRRLVRLATSSRVASREPSAPPSLPEPEAQNEEEPVRPRKTLTKRAGKKAMITGIDDPSSVIDAVPDLSMARRTPPPPAPAEVVDLTAPTPGRPTRLKRRFVGKDSNAGPSQTPMSGIEETIREPALKKFKALFEASNPEMSGVDVDSLPIDVDQLDSMPGTSAGLGASYAGASGVLASQTQTQTGMGAETQSRAESGRDRPLRSMGASGLAVLREEEEEETQGSLVQRERGTKRRMDSEEDVEMAIVEESVGIGVGVSSEGGTDALPAAKKRAVEGVNAVERVSAGAAATTAGATKPPSSVAVPATKYKQGAPPGKPDTDAAFLKAIASTKRGKKTEDAFDREFNKLKISKPELDKGRADPEEEWGVLADFGDDSGLRGNFMVVVEMDVCQGQKGERLGDGAKENEVRRAWDGKPNFKKFKKKDSGFSRSKVDLFVTDENELGAGASYWKAGHSHTRNHTQRRFVEVESQSQSQSQMESEINTETHRKQTRQKKNGNGTSNGRSQPILESDEEDVRPPPSRQPRKAPSRAGSAAPSRKATTTTKAKAKAPAKSSALFLDSDDDIQEVIAEEFEDDYGQEDAMMEEETLKSSMESSKAPVGRRSTRAAAKVPAKGKKAAPVIVDDDSDDEAVFKGFRGKKGR